MAVRATTEQQRPWRRWTTRQWLRTGVLTALVVLLVLGSLGGWVLQQASSETSTMVDHSSPALIEAVRLEGALINQETGVRGYGLSGQTDFLKPYTEGLADQKDAVARLRVLLAHDRTATADLDQVLARAESWQATVARPVAAAPAGKAVPLAVLTADRGKAEFDAIRSAAAVQQKHLQQERDTARASLDRIDTLRSWIFTAIAVVILLLAALVFEGLRRGVTTPLEVLSEDVRRVSGGDFEHPVDAATGPADLRLLAADVEGMRRRLAEELVFADRARQLLDDQAADLRRSNAELEQFAYVASHDLQEPLRKVASFCQLLQRRYADKLDERADQYIAFAVDGANRMQTLINDLLAFSRVGRVNTSYAAVDLGEILDRTLDAVALAVEESGAEITHDPLPTLTVDPTQMGMLLQNLITNAIKFRAPDRPPRIHVSAERGEDLWRFAVTDNGIGISPEYADRVFVIFQRLHTRDAYPGNGIGLAMCKKIVEYHGGTIEVDPDRASGTRISFTLPLEPPASLVAATAELTGAAEPQP
ncbi:ATP-binding protein [Streptacidiphilus sp. N1-3]|uniref:histidine kinase n=1 Tax=Streptacidiphilus alkalitolerans TaxID=3342712 RepID=A0ABV6X103_9ACTN